MTALDHSSTASFLADLDRRRDSVFCFRHGYGTGSLSARWKLKSVVLVAGGGVRLYIEYLNAGNTAFILGDMVLMLNSGLPTFNCSPMTVVALAPTGVLVPADSRDRIDENLRSVFG